MVYLGLKPRAAEWKAQTNPLSYGATTLMIFLVVIIIQMNLPPMAAMVGSSNMSVQLLGPWRLTSKVILMALLLVNLTLLKAGRGDTASSLTVLRLTLLLKLEG